MPQKLNLSRIKATPIKSNFTPAASRFSTTSTSFVDVPNCSFSYTSGKTPETLYLWWSLMALGTSYNGEGRCLVNGTTVVGGNVYLDPGSPWARATSFGTYDIPANTTVTIKIQVFIANSAGNVAVTNENANWVPLVMGFAVSQ